MKANLFLVMFVCLASMAACADENAEMNEAISPVVAVEASHPPLYDPEVHDLAFGTQPKMTFGQYVDFMLRPGGRSGLDKKLTVDEFYAKNPDWVPFKDKRMPDSSLRFGVRL